MGGEISLRLRQRCQYKISGEFYGDSILSENDVFWLNKNAQIATNQALIKT